MHYLPNGFSFHPTGACEMCLRFDPGMNYCMHGTGFFGDRKDAVEP
jgi:hypothetical protein